MCKEHIYLISIYTEHIIKTHHLTFCFSQDAAKTNEGTTSTLRLQCWHRHRFFLIQWKSTKKTQKAYAGDAESVGVSVVKVNKNWISYLVRYIFLENDGEYGVFLIPHFVGGFFSSKNLILRLVTGDLKVRLLKLVCCRFDFVGPSGKLT